MNAPELPALMRPRVLLPTCQRILDDHVFHTVGRKYIEAVRLAGCMPIPIPAIETDSLHDWLALADGILLTGSPSNVHPIYFGETIQDSTLPLDLERDRLTLAIIPKALERGIPLLAICRGLQEVNVALGGSLHQAVHQIAGHQDHRGLGPQHDVEARYGTSIHDIHIETGGYLEEVFKTQTIQVNSLHGQGIKQLAPGLRIEARASDGLIEAFSQPDAAAFNLCVQWHPEWMAASNPLSIQLFSAFGKACQLHRQQQHSPVMLEKLLP